MIRISNFAIALLVALVLAIYGTTPPRPLGKDAPQHAFSAQRAMDDVAVIAKEPHPTGSAANDEVRGYLTRRLQEMGLEVMHRSYLVSEAASKGLRRWSGQDNPSAEITNVIGLLPGKDRSLPAVMIMAHYDTVMGSPGAGDDTSGVATAIETARAIKASGQPPRDLILLFTDGEEIGLEGATNFFTSDPLRLHAGAVINMEARGGGGRALLFQTSKHNGEAVRFFAENTKRPRATSLAAYIYSVLPNDSDLTPALKYPVVAYNLAFIGRPGLYHSPKAVPDRLDQGALQDMGAQVLGLTRGLLDASKLPGSAPDVVFTDVFGLFLLAYPAWLGWMMLAIVTAGQIVLLRREPNWRMLGAGALRMAGFLALSIGVTFALNLTSGSNAVWANGYDRLAAIPMLEVMTALGLSSVALLVFGRGTPSIAAWVGASLPLALAGWGFQAIAPTAAFVVILPVTLAVAAALVPWRSVAVVVAALVVGDMLVLAHLLMQSVAPTMPMVAAIPASVAVLALLPLWDGIRFRKGLIICVAMLGAALAVALWVRLDPIADTVALYPPASR